MDYVALLDRLNGAGIRYLVAGGLAVNLYGIPRMTYDIDLVIDFVPDNLQRLRILLAELGYSPRVPVDLESLADESLRLRLAEEKHLLAMSYRRQEPPLGEIDLLTVLPVPFGELAGRVETVTVGGVRVPLISRSDLIAMKEASGRAHDREDAGQLRRIAQEGS
jgi:hypothetical protein